ncbi:hypothetical protein GCM10009730_55190 [Streptomyces albidochromogenes]
MTSYDLTKPRQRMGLYRTVLHEGLRDDLPRYLNRDLLLQLWPVLRTSAVAPCAPYGKTPSPSSPPAPRAAA